MSFPRGLQIFCNLFVLVSYRNHPFDGRFLNRDYTQTSTAGNKQILALKKKHKQQQNTYCILDVNFMM